MVACAMVLWFDKPFSELDSSFGLTKSAEIRMRTNPTEDIFVLVPRGFSNMEPRTVDRLRELRFRVVDVAPLLAEVRAEYPFANETRLWGNDPFHEMCFLRHLIMEKFFGDTPVLAMDNDVVWRVDPFELLSSWTSGKSFLCLGSTCLIYIAGKSWYEAYREGFRRLATDSEFGKDYSTGAFLGLKHDQALCQFLVKIKLMESDKFNLIGHGFQDKYCITANPLGMPGENLTFERKGNIDLVGGKIVPFWHVQSGFARYLSFALLIPLLTGKAHFRIPFEPRKMSGQTDLGAEILYHLHYLLSKGLVSFDAPRLRNARDVIGRAFLYEQFFDGDLASRVFNDTVWWKPGVWAS